MKIAICGGGPLGVEMAFSIWDLGGAYRIFSRGPLGGTFLSRGKHKPQASLWKTWKEATSVRGRGFLSQQGGKEWEDETFLQEIPTWNDYWEKYLSVLIRQSGMEKNYRQAEILRVHKRFLHPRETIEGKGRLHDLFRLVYTLNPSESVLAQREENPAIFDQMDPKMVDSLLTPLEFFEDFDMVVMATGVLSHPLKMGPGNSLAIGESEAAKASKIVYLSPWSPIEEMVGSPPAEHLCLVGSGATAALSLQKLKIWLEEKPSSRTLTLVTHEPHPFEKLRRNPDPWHRHLTAEWDHFLAAMQAREKKAYSCYEEDLKEWMGLDDFIKVKKKRPEPPVAAFSLFGGANVTAVDKLEDRSEIFLTLEWPPFRSGAIGRDPERDLRTLGFDRVLVACGFRMETAPFKTLLMETSGDEKETLSGDGTHPEDGLYTLGPTSREGRENDRYTLEEGSSQITKIEKNILSYFSPRSES